MKILILSDIHGNLNALESVMSFINNREIDACAILGDLIDYGPHSNEVIEKIKNFNVPIICNIWGNHECSIINDNYDNFSSQRGINSAKYTKSILSSSSLDFIFNDMIHSGFFEFNIGNKKCLFIHGSLENPFWKSISVDVDPNAYFKYNYVFSGHSHKPHFFEKYVKIEDYKYRNKKKILFINPGSVGQPRNINSYSQFVIFDTFNENIDFIKIPYDIKKEQAEFNNEIDEFYKIRLENGI